MDADEFPGRGSAAPRRTLRVPHRSLRPSPRCRAGRALPGQLRAAPASAGAG